MSFMETIVLCVMVLSGTTLSAAGEVFMGLTLFTAAALYTFYAIDHLENFGGARQFLTDALKPRIFFDMSVLLMMDFCFGVFTVFAFPIEIFQLIFTMFILGLMFVISVAICFGYLYNQPAKRFHTYYLVAGLAMIAISYAMFNLNSGFLLACVSLTLASGCFVLAAHYRPKLEELEEDKPTFATPELNGLPN